ncbi:MAG TPA: hypothetical protein VN087_10600 [Verrucomicrobiae bacterium]|jgi:hypothetical protein|nr:hypothetical protein [Verrucomicrobiae bacterium]
MSGIIVRAARALSGKTLLAAGLLASFSCSATGAGNITGSVRNLSRDQPAAGDEVILLRVDHAMQAEARANTGAQGAFALHVPSRAKSYSYVVRVIHQGVSYDQRASAGDVLSIQVFDVAARVRGITTSIEILRAGTNEHLLHVSDMYELRNESSPPVTQAGGRTFEVYLPANAKLDSVLAAGPEKIGAQITADLIANEPGHYAVNFPLRPGETKFAFNYDIPYNGRAVFETRLVRPLRQLAVMLPPSMKFSSRSPAFELLATGRNDFQVQTANQLEAGEGPVFEVSGMGALPPLGDQAKSLTPQMSPQVAGPVIPVPGQPALPSLGRIDSRADQAQPPSQSIVLGGLTAVLLTACGLLIWRAHKAQSISREGTITRPSPLRPSDILRDALRQELSRLDADRKRGMISRKEYSSAKLALKESVKRALARAS